MWNKKIGLNLPKDNTDKQIKLLAETLWGGGGISKIS